MLSGILFFCCTYRLSLQILSLMFSSLSLRYLQFESRALPSIDPLPTISNGRLPDNVTLLRTQSSGSLNGREDDANNNQNKLPTLLLPPTKISASVDNCKFILCQIMLNGGLIQFEKLKCMKKCHRGMTVKSQ